MLVYKSVMMICKEQNAGVEPTAERLYHSKAQGGKRRNGIKPYSYRTVKWK